MENDAEGQKIYEELRAMRNIVDAFSENFECKDFPCEDCPIGVELCLVMNKAELDRKTTLTGAVKVLLRMYWKDLALVGLVIALIYVFLVR